MKKNLYYRTMFQRENLLKVWFLTLFVAFASPTRLLLEVFTRKDFGERYFRLSSALTVASILALLPIALRYLKIFMTVIFASHNVDVEGMQNSAPASPDPLMPHYLGWYIFLVVFLVLSFRHKKDMARNPSVFDFAKFSLSSGQINPVFFRVKIPGIQTDVRLVECLIEPVGFFVAGALLALIGQKLGILLIVSSFCYAMSYVRDYRIGDNFVMDKIDEIISNEELEKAFVDDMSEDETRGFRFRGHKPDNHDMRRKILPLMTDDEEILEAK